MSHQHQAGKPADDDLDDLDDDVDDLDDDLDDPDDDPKPPPPAMPSLVYGHEIGERGIRPIEWLWEPYLAFGSLAVIDGDPGTGKSLVTIDIAARIGTGRDFPDGKPAPRDPARPQFATPTVFVNAEDSVRRTILPRLSAAHGNPNTVAFLGGVGEEGCSMRFPDDFVRFAQVLERNPRSFVVLDPMMALISKRVTAGGDQAIRELLTPLARVAADSRCCLLMVRHLNPRQAKRALYRGAGSIGILGACRTGLIVERHPDDPERRVLAMTKSNLGPVGPSLGFRVKLQPEQIVERLYKPGEKNPETGEVLKEAKRFTNRIPAEPVIEWEGVSSLTADDLCFAKPDATGPGLRAAAWLKKVLANGPVAATEIEKLAAKEEFGFTTVRAAKQRLKIESRYIVVDGRRRWEWMLPEHAVSDQ